MKQILIVEDKPASRELLRTVLERQGDRVFQARDGKQGKQMVYQHPPDLVILDMMMPRMGGYSVLEHFNGLSGYLNLVIPFCIALALPGSDSKLRNLGRWGFVLLSIALLLTQSRGGLLAYAAMLITSACFLTSPSES